MNNVVSLASQRLAGSVLSCARWPTSTQLLRQAAQLSRSHHDDHRLLPLFKFSSRTSNTQSRSFSQTRTAAFHPSVAHALRTKKAGAQPAEEPQEKGHAFRKKDLTVQEVRQVFGAQHPPVEQANRLLRVLHGRRKDGTLDMPLPPDMQAVLRKYPSATTFGLHWLRQSYRMDEETAMMARIEREETGQHYSPSEIKQRGQDGDLYSGPQSGHYHARLSESDREGDVWGKSELEEIRAENEAQAALEEEQLQAEIDEKMAAEQLKLDTRKQAQLEQQAQLQDAAAKQVHNNAVTARPAAEVSTDVKPLRPPNEYEKWVIRNKKAGQSKFTEDSPEVAEMSFARRVLPCAFFAALVCVGCYLYAQYWTPPRRADRRYPDWPLTYATLWVLVFANLAVLSAWKFPPMWKYLNKYFILTPAYPRVLSLVGNTFSHQGYLHFFNNMLGLAILGSALHEEVGRGTFLAIYLAGGTVGSLASLVFHAGRGVLTTSSLGASGSVCAIAAALTWLNADREFTLIFLPQEWRETFAIKGWAVACALLTYELGSLFFRKWSTIDHVGHLGGMAVGFLTAQSMHRKQAEEKLGMAKGHGRFSNILTDLRDRLGGDGKKGRGQGRDLGTE